MAERDLAIHDFLVKLAKVELIAELFLEEIPHLPDVDVPDLVANRLPRPQNVP